MAHRHVPSKADVTVGYTAAQSSSTPDALIGFKLPPRTRSYTERDLALYALGVGVTTKQPDFLKFLFELNEDFCALPTYGVILGQSELAANCPSLPVPIDPTKILHGEHYLQLYKPLPTSGTVRTETVITDVIDKGSGALLIFESITFDEKGEKLLTNQNATFVQKMGGWGGRRRSDKLVEHLQPPKRTPDASIREKTSIDQAALYRLNGDYNPLHISPAFATGGGFAKPILHGLCSLAISSKHVLQQYCANDVTKFKAIKVRFSKPVLPGQTLQTDMWKEGSRIFFQTKVVESGGVCLTGAYVDLVGVSAKEADDSSFMSSGELMTDLLFAGLDSLLKDKPELVQKIKAVYQFNITKDGKTVAVWTADMKKDSGAVYKGPPKEGKPGLTITISDQDFVDIASGKLNGQQAFMAGKLKVKGNVMLGMKLDVLSKAAAKL